MDFNDVSSLTSYASSMATKTNSAELTNKVNNAQTDEELMEACKQFETYLWEQVVKSMKDTTNLFGEDSSNSQMVDYFMDTAITEVAGQMTDQSMGPNSLAQQMFEQMKRYNTVNADELIAKSMEIAQQEKIEEKQEVSEDALATMASAIVTEE